MKIVLIPAPNFDLQPWGFKAKPYVPLGVLSLASVVESMGHGVEIVDVSNLLRNKLFKFNRSIIREITQHIENCRPDLVGFSSMCNSYPLTIRMARELSYLIPEVPIILGGPYASVVDIQTLEYFPFIHSIIRGEAETSFRRFLQNWNKDSIEIEGLTTRVKGKIVKFSDGRLINNLDLLPMPAFNKYPIGGFSRLPVEAGRGCPFQCTFCSTNLYFQRKYRVKSPVRILNEMKLLNAITGVTHFDLAHDMFTIDKKFVKSFCLLLIEQNTGFTWGCSARVDCVDKEILKLMGRAGCRDLFFGIETGSKRMQSILRKKLHLSDVVPILSTARRMGIRPTASFIIGYPDERTEDLYSSFKLAMKLLFNGVTRIHFHKLAPLPGTPLTMQYFEDLEYSGLHSDITWTVLQKNDKKLIRDYKKIFVSFYSYPMKYLSLIHLYFTLLLVYVFVGPAHVVKKLLRLH